jgi:hypothetical protein
MARLRTREANRSPTQCHHRAPRSTNDHDYVLGVDLARITDHTVASVLDPSTEPVHQVHVDRFHRVDWDVQIDRLTAVVRRYRPRVVVVDRMDMGDLPYLTLAERLAAECPRAVARRAKCNAANKLAPSPPTPRAIGVVAVVAPQHLTVLRDVRHQPRDERRRLKRVAVGRCWPPGRRPHPTRRLPSRRRHLTPAGRATPGSARKGARL